MLNIPLFNFIPREHGRLSDEIILATVALIAKAVAKEISSQATTRLSKANPINFYNGISGSALFLAAHSKATGSAEYAAVSRQCFDRLLGEMRGIERLKELHAGGALTGVLSFSYALCLGGELLKDPYLAGEALGLACRYEESDTMACASHEVAEGLAGRLLILLAIRDRIKQETERRVLATLAEDVAGKLSMLSDSWHGRTLSLQERTGEKMPLCGFAHGLAGVAVSLARSSNRLDNLDFLEGVKSAVGYTRSCYSSMLQGWCLSPLQGSLKGAGWCHGAPGIALALASVLKDCGETLGQEAQHIREDLQRACSITWTEAPNRLDHLCCGNMGRIETFLELAVLVDSDEIRDSAHRMTSVILRWAKTRGGFELGSEIPGDISLFQGLAGIGYTLLRLVKPDCIPPLLLLE